MKKLPKFKNEAEERKFWQTHDFTDYIDFNDAKNRVEGDFVNLKPSTKKVTMRMPESMLNDLKMIANKRDVPYQSYIKIKLDEIIKKEMSATT
jgi:predicted DNA binding CopG/RHH family protein